MDACITLCTFVHLCACLCVGGLDNPVETSAEGFRGGDLYSKYVA